MPSSANFLFADTEGPGRFTHEREDMPRYLCYFVQQLLEFRLPELHALVDLANGSLTYNADEYSLEVSNLEVLSQRLIEIESLPFDRTGLGKNAANYFESLYAHQVRPHIVVLARTF